MAVTQQLVRLAPDLLQRCREDAGALGELVSFMLAPEDCYLDLDWAPSELQAMAREAGDSAAEGALRLSCAGARLVNSRFPKFEVYELPMDLDAGEVRSTSEALATVDFDALLRKAKRAGGADDLRRRFMALRHFYTAAASANQAVVVWWD